MKHGVDVQPTSWLAAGTQVTAACKSATWDLKQTCSGNVSCQPPRGLYLHR